MPNILGRDTFAHGDFTVPGGANYSVISGTPAKDTSILHAPDPASLLISTTAAAENVENLIPGTPTIGCQGYWFRLNAADEPGSDFNVAQISTTDGAGGRIDFQVSTNKFFAYVAGGSEFPTSVAYTFDTWIWIAQILDVSSGTRTHYTWINGEFLTPANRTIAASTCSNVILGPTGANTTTCRYSDHYWGSSANVRDFIVPPTRQPHFGFMGAISG